MLVAVIASRTLAIVTFYLAVVDLFYSLPEALVSSADPSLGSQAYGALRDDTLTHIIKALDLFLIGSILLLFAFGLYELFISNIDVAGDRTAPFARAQAVPLKDTVGLFTGGPRSARRSQGC